MLAIIAGFIGVMIIIRPGTEAFDQWSLMGVASVLCVVVRDLAVRRMGAHVSSVIVALGAAVAVAVVGLGLSMISTAGMGASFAGLTGWRPVGPVQAMQVLGAGGFLIVGYICAVSAMRWGDIGVVAPFRYTSLLWAILLGFTFFGTLPDGWTMIGAAVVVASGVYTLLRERKLRRQAAGAV
jgi:drug/metabolite transporter (DMT)-like permease